MPGLDDYFLALLSIHILKSSQRSLVESSWKAENLGCMAVNAESLHMLGASIIQTVELKITNKCSARNSLIIPCQVNGVYLVEKQLVNRGLYWDVAK